MIPCQALDLSVLKDAGYFHDLRYSGNLYVSMAGGSILRFGAHSGLNDEPINNKVSFKNTDIFSGREITIQGPNMDGK